MFYYILTDQKKLIYSNRILKNALFTRSFQILDRKYYLVDIRYYNIDNFLYFHYDVYYYFKK